MDESQRVSSPFCFRDVTVSYTQLDDGTEIRDVRLEKAIIVTRHRVLDKSVELVQASIVLWIAFTRRCSSNFLR